MLEIIFKELFELKAPAVAASILFVVAGILAVVLGGRLLRYFLNSASAEPRVQVVIVRAFRYSVILIVLLSVLDILGVEITSLLTGLGVFGVVIAFGLRTTSNNFFSGLALQRVKPFAVGDYISGGGVEGLVVDMHLMYTLVRSSDGSELFVPNGVLWAKAIRNQSRPGPRLIEYDVSVRSVTELGALRKALVSALEQDLTSDASNPPSAKINDLDGDGGTIRVRIWLDAEDVKQSETQIVEILQDAASKAGAVDVSVARFHAVKKAQPVRADGEAADVPD